MLRLTFYAALGEPAAQVRASSFRLCADATLRANDHSVSAARVDGAWLIARRSFRHFDCAGPVLLIARRTVSERPVCLGPFSLVRAGAALIWGDEELLPLRVPGWSSGDGAIYEVSFVDPAAERDCTS